MARSGTRRRPPWVLATAGVRRCSVQQLRFHCGPPRSVLSRCFVVTVEDGEEPGVYPPGQWASMTRTRKECAMQATSPCRRSAPASRCAILLLTALACALVAPSNPLRAGETVAEDSIAIAQYNVQFLFPSWVPTLVLEALDHFPDSSERASLIGQVMACRDIVSFNEISNDDRRADIFASMESNAGSCGRAPLIDGGTRFWDFYVGPDNAQTDPILDDEIAIASRFPITQVHTLVDSNCSREDCLAHEGALHGRVWQRPGPRRLGGRDQCRRQTHT